MNYYISDTHLGHYNIIRLCSRPFKTAEEMDEVIINNWNSVVKDTDTVYIGGDFCFKSGKDPVEYLKKLNGHKHLCIGNHDKSLLKNPAARKYFESIKDMYNIEDNGKRIVLCHYPMVEWDGFFRGTIHLYGHIHNNTSNATYDIVKNIPNCYNMGADVLGFTPRTLDEIVSMNKTN